MAIALNIYATGTVSIANGATVAVGTSTNWQGANARSGDDLIIAGKIVPILDVTDTTHLVIPAWQGSTVTNSPYEIFFRSPTRYMSVDAMKDISKIVQALNADGYEIYVSSTEAVPDVSLGEDNQFAYQPSTRKRWVKVGGLWSYQGTADAVFSRYDIGIYDLAKPLASEILAKYYPTGVTFHIGMSESIARCDIVPTATAVFNLCKNGTSFATITFGAGSNVGAFVCPAETSFASGDLFSIVAPTSPDTTLAGLSMTATGYR